MSEKFYGEVSETAALRSWVLMQMLRGMGWAAVFTFAIGLLYLGLYGVSLLLPAESKQAPSPYNSMLEIAAPLYQTA